MATDNTRHRGGFRQIPIYLGKFFRMFIFMDDWKVLPFSALIAALVSYAVGNTMFVTMEGTAKGALALTCVLIWNGFFNSIQSICRERDVIKREHRSGMKIGAYLSAQVIYQAFLCLTQAIITLVVFYMAGMKRGMNGVVTPFFLVDLTITFFLISFSADMLSLMISSISKNTTFAMTIMPFVLVFQLVFSGGVFALQGGASVLTNLTIAKWGMCAICAIGGFNSLPTYTVWNQLINMKGYEYQGLYPVQMVIDGIEKSGNVEAFCMEIASNNQVAAYSSDVGNILNIWSYLLDFGVVFIILCLFFLSRIDKDKR